MEISFDELREKEVVNIKNGKKLGHIIDLIFDMKTGQIRGIIVPGDKKLFKKSDDIFISIKQIRTIGDDVVLIEIKGYDYNKSQLTSQNMGDYRCYESEEYMTNQDLKYKKGNSFIRYRRINNNKYK